MACTIARLPGAKDTFGGPTAAASVATGVACYWWSQSGSRLADSGAPGIVATETEHILFVPGTDVRQGDQITTVVDGSTTIFAAPDYRVVEHVVPQRNHIDCTLRFGEAIGGRA